MYPYNYIVPYNRGNMHRNNNRVFGGFAVPFLLGGITGSLLTRPNYYYYPNYYPMGYPMNYNYYYYY
ncbi:MAG: hypothetical protein GX861_01730 [Tenericutes bacterium]|jgi:hypothetical protein|nr:hypothetical protein [Mycoplasmatota bacterium]